MCYINEIDLNVFKLNVSKTQSDFRKDSSVVAPVVVNGEDVEMLRQNKNLWAALGDDLTLDVHADLVRAR